MSDIDLKALRERANRACEQRYNDLAINVNRVIALLDRLESAERRAEEAEKAIAARPARDWQYRCLERGFEYVRESDDHYVLAGVPEMAALLGELLGVEVRSKENESYGETVRELRDELDAVSGAHMRAYEAEKERDALTARILSGPADTTVTIQDGAFLGQLTDAMGAIERAGQDFVDQSGSLLSLAEQIDRLDGERDALRKATPELDHVIKWLANGCSVPHAIEELKIYKSRIDAAKSQRGGAETPDRNAGNGVDAGVEGGAEAAQSLLREAGVARCDPDGMPRTLAQQVEILVAERDAFARDAERYRWICDGHGYFLEEQGIGHIDPDKPGADAAIDERMAQESGK